MPIRLAEYTDAESINRIYNQAIVDRCTADTRPKAMEETAAWLRLHDRHQFPVWVYEDDHTVCGWLSLSAYRNGRPAVNKLVECSYYVDRAFRGRGVGSALLAHAIEKARLIGYRHMLAIILERNKASISFTEKHGFHRWGYLPDVADFGDERCGHCYYGMHI